MSSYQSVDPLGVLGGREGKAVGAVHQLPLHLDKHDLVRAQIVPVHPFVTCTAGNTKSRIEIYHCNTGKEGIRSTRPDGLFDSVFVGLVHPIKRILTRQDSRQDLHII